MKKKDRCGRSGGEAGMFMKIKHLSSKSRNVSEKRQVNVLSRNQQDLTFRQTVRHEIMAILISLGT
jgi:hypothetical protein